MRLVDIAEMPNHNPSTKSRGEHSVSEGKVTEHSTNTVNCQEHGAMLCVNPQRTIWRCEACGAGAYVATLPNDSSPRSQESPDVKP